MGTTVQTSPILGGVVTPLVDAATIVWAANQGIAYSVSIAGNRTMANPTDLIPGTPLTLYVIQGAGGNHAITWGSAFQGVDGTMPDLSTAEGAIDVFLFSCDGTHLTPVGFTKGVGSPLTAPSVLVATTNLVERIDLSWTNNDATAQGTLVQQWDGISSWGTIATVAYPTAAYSVDPIGAGSYDFRVKAYRATVLSPASNTATGVSN